MVNNVEVKKHFPIPKISKILLTSMLFISSATISFANSTAGDEAMGELQSGSGVYGIFGEITSILAMLGFLIAIGKMMQIGMQFMIGAGKGRSDAKSSLIPWAVGAAICATYAVLGPTIINLIMSGGGSGGVFGI